MRKLHIRSCLHSLVASTCQFMHLVRLFVTPFGAMRFAFANRAEVVECINCIGGLVCAEGRNSALAFGERDNPCYHYLITYLEFACSPLASTCQFVHLLGPLVALATGECVAACRAIRIRGA